MIPQTSPRPRSTASQTFATFATVLTALLFSLAGTPPATAQAPAVLEVPAAEKVASQVPRKEPQRFEFRVNFWPTLHHHLRGEARRKVFPKRYRANPIPSELPLAERAAWEGALAIYDREVLLKDLLRDRDLVALKDALGELGDAPNLSTLRAKFPPPFGEVLDALEAAAPIYRVRLWAEHERGAKEWIATVDKLLDRHSEKIVPSLERVFRTEWPAEPMVVQVTSEAGPTGAYATVDPIRITFAAFDNRNQGMPALEILFHEAAHGLVRSVHTALDQEATRQNRQVVPDLWHALLFYSVGEVVRRELHAQGMTDYRPYAAVNGLWSRDWAGLDAQFERTWRPWIDGTATFDLAIRDTVASAPPPPSDGIAIP